MLIRQVKIKGVLQSSREAIRKANFMTPEMRQLFERAKYWFPPIMLYSIKNLIYRSGYFGDYSSWEAAKFKSGSYANPEILRRTRDALLKVKTGQAVYERDSVLFDTVHHSWPLLACLQRVALENDGCLSVLDFGGSLGSSYFQCRGFLTTLHKLEWSVVEQKDHVECGKREFEDDILAFYYNVEQCIKIRNPNVILFSSVLQYIEKPYDLLSSILYHGFNNVIIDRSPFRRCKRDMITVQKVSPKIYDACYPSWIFSDSKFKAFFMKNYQLFAEFDNPGAPTFLSRGRLVVFKGFMLKRRNSL